MSTTVIILRFEAAWSATDRRLAGLGRILVPLDGSALARAALIPAEELARRTGARLELLSTKVAEGPPRPSSFLDDIAEEISDGGAGVELRTSTRLEGDPVRAIEAAVEEGGAPVLIVMSSHGRGRFRRAALGSTAELVVASAAAPVLVVGPSWQPDAFQPGGPVVLAHDGDHEPDLDVVARLAQTASGQITVLQVFPSPSPSLARHHSGSVVSEAAADCASRLRAMGFEVTTEAERAAQTHKVIVDVAGDLGASYVVI
ncbi:MAG: universal stress protein, partial [Acidimicrobiia bacterium]|nr:universal stress protein [Acidimicrobiia bacterium]